MISLTDAQKDSLLYAIELAYAFEMLGLGPYDWTVHSCDAGYHCRIHHVPEAGGQLIHSEVADTMLEAINAARVGADELIAREAKVSNDLRDTAPN